VLPSHAGPGAHAPRKTAARRWTRTFAIAITALCAPAAQAQDAFPTKPIRVVVPFAVGSANDLIPRLLGPRLSQRLGQPVVVENQTGGGGLVATEAVIKAAPDGHTLLVGTSSGMVMNLALYRKLPYEIDKRLTGAGLIARTTLALVANPNTPGATLQEMIAYAKANPGKITYGSGGNGSISHIVPEYFRRLTGIEIQHVPYRGNGPALVDLIGGQIHLLFDSPQNGAQLMAKGAVKVYAVGGEQRHPILPGVPTFIESGVKDFDPYTWNGLMAPSGTPQPVLEKLNRELNAVLAEPEIAASLDKMGAQRIGGRNLEGTNAFIAAERARWVPLVRSLNVALD
jgi:tripartite-type tricarboxylate transporter receptor subunit TctC